jgi:hypothetical protein
MKNILFTTCYLLFASCLSAQSPTTQYPFFQNIKGDRKVFADTVVLRLAPSTGAATGDTLYLGDNINILMEVPYSEVRNNIVAPWFKITYKKGGYTKVGFISAFDIAINDNQTAKDVEFVWGLEKNTRTDSIVDGEIKFLNHYTAKLKVKGTNKKWMNEVIDIPASMNVDTVMAMSFKKIKLNNSRGVVQIELSSTTVKSVIYQYNIILCNKNRVAQLEVINTVQNPQKELRPLRSSYIFSSNKIVFKMSGFMDGDKELDTYKWKDCSIIKL